MLQKEAFVVLVFFTGPIWVDADVSFKDLVRKVSSEKAKLTMYTSTNNISDHASFNCFLTSYAGSNFERLSFLIKQCKFKDFSNNDCRHKYISVAKVLNFYGDGEQIKTDMNRRNFHGEKVRVIKGITGYVFNIWNIYTDVRSVKCEAKFQQINENKTTTISSNAIDLYISERQTGYPIEVIFNDISIEKSEKKYYESITHTVCSYYMIPLTTLNAAVKLKLICSVAGFPTTEIKLYSYYKYKIDKMKEIDAFHLKMHNRGNKSILTYSMTFDARDPYKEIFVCKYGDPFTSHKKNSAPMQCFEIEAVIFKKDIKSLIRSLTLFELGRFALILSVMFITWMLYEMCITETEKTEEEIKAIAQKVAILDEAVVLRDKKKRKISRKKERKRRDAIKLKREKRDQYKQEKMYLNLPKKRVKRRRLGLGETRELPKKFQATKRNMKVDSPEN